MSKSRTALFIKEGVITALTLEIGRFGSVRICRFDPRERSPIARGPWDFLPEAQGAFERSKRTSEGRGWRVVYEGPPLRG